MTNFNSNFWRKTVTGMQFTAADLPGDFHDGKVIGIDFSGLNMKESLSCKDSKGNRSILLVAENQSAAESVVQDRYEGRRFIAWVHDLRWVPNWVN